MFVKCLNSYNLALNCSLLFEYDRNNKQSHSGPSIYNEKVAFFLNTSTNHNKGVLFLITLTDWLTGTSEMDLTHEMAKCLIPFGFPG